MVSFNTVIGLIFLMGIILTYLSYNSIKELKSTCVDKQVNLGLNILLMVGTMLIGLCLAYFFCVWRCDCPDRAGLSSKFVPFILILGVLMLVDGAMVWSKLKGDCDSSTAKRNAGIITLGGVAVIGLMSFILYQGRNRSSPKLFRDNVPEGKESSYDSTGESSESYELE